jgi:hypothetical protein
MALEAIAAHSNLALAEAIQSQRTRSQSPDASHPDTTYNLTVSDADGDSVPQQIAEADAFLTSIEQSLRSIIQTVPRCKCSIDFSWDFPRDSVGQYNSFPTAFLARLASFDIALVVSVYGVTRTEVVG